MLVVPGYLKRLSVAYYLQALVVHDVPQDSGPLVILQAFRESPSLVVALMALAVIVVAALWLAGRVVERREIRAGTVDRRSTSILSAYCE